LRLRSQKKKIPFLDDSIEEKINKLWQPPSPINLIEVDPFIVWDAKALIREAIKNGWGLKPADAIHLATAQRIQADYFHTYDIDKLGKFAKVTNLKIEVPKSNRLVYPPEKQSE
jgi:predicted nucleic acid-binding protein